MYNVLHSGLTKIFNYYEIEKILGYFVVVTWIDCYIRALCQVGDKAWRQIRPVLYIAGAKALQVKLF